MKQVLAITLLLSSICSCAKKGSNNPEREDPVIVGKISGLNVLPGKNRVKLIWKQPVTSSGVKVSQYRVFWNSNADSLQVSAPATDEVATVIGNLAEDNYTFSVYAYDNKGNRSQSTAANGRSYGSEYEAALTNRTFKDTIFNAITKAAVITWNPSGAGVIGCDIKYTDTLEVSHTLKVESADEIVSLSGYKIGSTIAWRTLFLPVPEAIDTFYTEYETIEIYIQPDEDDGEYASMVNLEADGPGDTYELMGSVLGGSPEETPDCGHVEFGRHITEEFNSELNKNVFAFYAHRDFDDDRCGATDRQRTEIKTYSPSPATVKAFNGDEMIFRWKFRLAEGFQPSSSFTHIHQIKAGDGTNAGSPLITITPRYGSPNKLEIIHTGDANVSNQGKVKVVDLSSFEGTCLGAVEKINLAHIGYIHWF